MKDFKKTQLNSSILKNKIYFIYSAIILVLFLQYVYFKDYSIFARISLYASPFLAIVIASLVGLMKGLEKRLVMIIICGGIGFLEIIRILIYDSLRLPLFSF